MKKFFNARLYYYRNLKHYMLMPIRNRVGLLALSILFSCSLVLIYGQQADAAVSAQDLQKSLAVQLFYDPLLKTGYFLKEGNYLSFAADQPYLALDFRQIVKVSAPYHREGVLLFPPDARRAVENYYSAKQKETEGKYSVAAILIDPGHGGKDTGAVAELGTVKLFEKNLTLAVSKRVIQLLSERYPNRKILTTREGDSYPTLDQRVEMANSIPLKPSQAVIYVSIHANASFNKNAKGFEVWYLNPEYRRTVVDATTVQEKGKDIAPILNAMLEEEFTTESIILARKVYDRLGSLIGDASPGRGIRAEEWFVVRNAKMPSILIEMGFITNPEEGLLLADSVYLRKIADAIYNGIVDFIEHFER